MREKSDHRSFSFPRSGRLMGRRRKGCKAEIEIEIEIESRK